MSYQPTPETERIKGALHTNWNDLMNHARKLERERDEAREALADWENAAAHVEADHPDEKHCGCVFVLRKLLADARSERDEARDALMKIEEVFIDSDDTYEALGKMGNIARSALESKI